MRPSPNRFRMAGASRTSLIPVYTRKIPGVYVGLVNHMCPKECCADGGGIEQALPAYFMRERSDWLPLPEQRYYRK